MTPNRRLSPSRSIGGIDNDAISRTQERRSYLDRDNLRSLGGDVDPQRDMDAATELFLESKSRASAAKRALQYVRLPSLQADTRNKAMFAASEVLSQRSRLSRISNPGQAASSTRARSIAPGQLEFTGLLQMQSPRQVRGGPADLTQI